jgi:hypothetical protein
MFHHRHVPVDLRDPAAGGGREPVNPVTSLPVTEERRFSPPVRPQRPVRWIGRYLDS